MDDTESLKKRREILRKRFYILIFEIFGIFGIPAFGAYFLGKYLINNFGFGSYIWVIVLIPSFILGWVIFVFRFKNISNDLKEINQRINNNEYKNK